MPIHDWAQVPAGLFHHFHQSWSIEMARSLNRNNLPKGLSALVEQRSGIREPDILAIESRGGLRPAKRETEEGGAATVERPRTQIIRSSSKEIYSGRANRIVVRYHLGRIVAIIEIVSPGNKDSRAALRDLVDKTIDCIREGIHVLIMICSPPRRVIPRACTK